jgi:hypothetical protein
VRRIALWLNKHGWLLQQQIVLFFFSKDALIISCFIDEIKCKLLIILDLAVIIARNERLIGGCYSTKNKKHLL